MLTRPSQQQTTWPTLNNLQKSTITHRLLWWLSHGYIAVMLRSVLNSCSAICVLFATSNSLLSFTHSVEFIRSYLDSKSCTFWSLQRPVWCWLQDRLRTLMSMVHSVEKMEQLLGISSKHAAGERMQYSRLSISLTLYLTLTWNIWHHVAVQMSLLSNTEFNIFVMLSALVGRIKIIQDKKYFRL